MLGKFASLIAALVLAVTGAVVTAPPAQAEPGSTVIHDGGAGPIVVRCAGGAEHVVNKGGQSPCYYTEMVRAYWSVDCGYGGQRLWLYHNAGGYYFAYLACWHYVARGETWRARVKNA